MCGSKSLAAGAIDTSRHFYLDEVTEQHSM
jgi:hypothetical protein